MKRKILFVAMADSSHVARWIDLIADENWDLHLFPVYLAPAHSLMRGVRVHEPWLTMHPRRALKQWIKSPRSICSLNKMKQLLSPNSLPVSAVYPIPIVPPLDRILSAFRTMKLGESNVRAPLPFGPRVLARLIKKLKPDLIHSMEFQHAGYNVLRAKEMVGPGKWPKWLATNWGSDIFYYRNFSDHRKQITRLLTSADYYSCECERDVFLAREMGMTAKPLPVFPNTGGFDVEAIATIRGTVKPSTRRIIMVKGYQHFAGRALTALDAIVGCSDLLQEYQIVVFSASEEVIRRVEELRLFYGLNIRLLGYTAHEMMLRFFAHARIYVGISVSDAISTSMLEAMAMGAFPIQTNTACCNEWIVDARSGFIVPADDVETIASRIRQAITDDTLVDRAAEINWDEVVKRLDKNILRMKERELYEQIFADIRP